MVPSSSGTIHGSPVNRRSSRDGRTLRRAWGKHVPPQENKSRLSTDISEIPESDRGPLHAERAAPITAFTPSRRTGKREPRIRCQDHFSTSAQRSPLRKSLQILLLNRSQARPSFRATAARLWTFCTPCFESRHRKPTLSQSGETRRLAPRWADVCTASGGGPRQRRLLLRH